MLRGKDKRYLRGLAVNLKASIQCGKEGIGDNLIQEVLGALKRDELVKISVNKTSPLTLGEASARLAELTGSEVVQSIGRKFVLYKESEEEPVIILPE